MRLFHCSHFAPSPSLLPLGCRQSPGLSAALLKGCSLLCLLLLAGGAVASEPAPHYRIETLIFAVLRGGDEGEYWQPGGNLYFPANMMYLEATDSASQNLGSDEAPPEDARLPSRDLITPISLPTTAAHLADVREKLEAQGGFRILFHELWEQPVYDEDAAPYLLVRGGREYGKHRELEGVLQLSINRYLHLKADLRLSAYRRGRRRGGPWPLPAVPPQPDAGTDFPAGKIRQVVQVLEGLWQESRTELTVERTVRLHQRRRMRSGELHYLDHPMLGMLVLVRPAEI